MPARRGRALSQVVERPGGRHHEELGVGLGLHRHDAVHRCDQAHQFVDRLVALRRVERFVLAQPFHLVEDRVLQLHLSMEQEDVLPQRADAGFGLDAAAAVRLRQQFDVADRRQHGPGAGAQHRTGHVVGVGQEAVVLSSRKGRSTT